MSRHFGHQLRLTAFRTRIQPHSQPQPQHGTCPHHEPAPQARLRVPGQRRGFSVADGASGLLRCSEWLITIAHEAAGAPWFVSISLAALAVNAAVRTPLKLYAHQTARRRALLAPLIQAQTAVVALGLRKRAEPNLRQRVAEITRKRTKKLMVRFAARQRIGIISNVVTLPLFVSNMEVLRRMCGGSRSLIGSLLLGACGADAPKDTAAATVSGNAMSPISATDLVETAASTHRDVISSISFEPTLASEGCLWFPDLLQPDPLYILPFSLSAVLVAHMIPNTAAARRELVGLSPIAGDKHSTLMGQSRTKRAFQRTILILSLAIGPMTMDLPAALHLYMLSSAGLGLAVSKGLERALPISVNTVRPCKGMEIPLLRPKPLV